MKSAGKRATGAFDWFCRVSLSQCTSVRVIFTNILLGAFFVYSIRSETGTNDVTRVVEERRSSAKELLLDIQREMGKEKMAEVAGAIISLNQGSERESKEALLRILKNQPQLHQRLVKFLPRRFFK